MDSAAAGSAVAGSAPARLALATQPTEWAELLGWNEPKTYEHPSHATLTALGSSLCSRKPLCMRFL